jgi:HPt (histidine-containing phosphotransfer) domain-containing protein
MTTNSPQEIAPGLVIRGFTPPRSMGDFKLLVFGMDSAMLYPGAEELADACKTAGMTVDVAIGELSDGAEKLQALQATCAKLGLQTGQAIVLGSSASDIPMLQAAGLGAAYRPSAEVAEHSMVAIQTGGFDRLLQVLTLHRAEEAPGLDLSVLEMLVGHDATKFRKFALLFISSMETVLTEVDTAVAQKDMATLGAMGHRAKSTALNIGATAFSRQCLALEQTSRAQKVDEAISIAQSLRPMFVAICQAIHQRMETTQPT